MAAAGKKAALALAGVGGAYLGYSALMGLGGSGGHAKATAEQVAKSSEMYKLLRDGNSHSLLKKHLTPEVFEQLKTRATKHGGSLYNVIVSGAKNPEAHCGVYAPDAEAYKVFAALFDPIIEEYHKFGPKEKQPAMDLGEGKYDQFPPARQGRQVHPLHPHPLRTLHQGLPAEPADEGGRLQGDGASGEGGRGGFRHTRAQGKVLSPTRHVQGRPETAHQGPLPLQGQRPSPGDGGRVPLLAGGSGDLPQRRQDLPHLARRGGPHPHHLHGVRRRRGQGPEASEQRYPGDRVEGAVHAGPAAGLGDLLPHQLGSTVRASVHIKLPKVSARPDFEKLCDGMQLQVRGIHGEGSKSEGGVYDISNKRRLGLSEFQAVKEMYDGIKKLIEMEERGGK